MALTDKLTNIANAIRAKTSETSKMSLDEMPGKIENISGDVTPPYVKETYNSNRDLVSAIFVGYTKIRPYACYNCGNLSNINFQNCNITDIGSSAFSCCINLTSFTIPDSVNNIGDSAFDSCEYLTSIVIPNSITNIGVSAFQRCRRLQSINIPGGITSIKSYTFTDCSSLTSIIIPANVETIGYAAFGRCTSLTTIRLYRVEPPSISNTSFSSTTALESIIVPKGSGEAYKLAPNWSSYSSKIEEAE